MTDVLKIKETNFSISLQKIEENINHNTKSDSNQIDIEYQLWVQSFVRM